MEVSEPLPAHAVRAVIGEGATSLGLPSIHFASHPPSMNSGMDACPDPTPKGSRAAVMRACCGAVHAVPSSSSNSTSHALTLTLTAAVQATRGAPSWSVFHVEHAKPHERWLPSPALHQALQVRRGSTPWRTAACLFNACSPVPPHAERRPVVFHVEHRSATQPMPPSLHRFQRGSSRTGSSGGRRLMASQPRACGCLCPKPWRDAGPRACPCADNGVSPVLRERAFTRLLVMLSQDSAASTAGPLRQRVFHVEHEQHVRPRSASSLSP
ncbi:hypothetical protein EJ065_7699 [Corallococcus coralloides]|uniref:Uncharacterized protein n=1 Tax=Corallococcus coralloides TaxID=184914 RepID=A0A410S502_CORCK|nr:hypothetical protein EJ065_7699 [Corallococcus coralloides]